MLDPQACYRALRARDERYDGRFFVGVTSTGIYCRPVCPAPPPRFENCTFHATAAAAGEAGFRPCLRCRPETAPELGSWRGSSNTVSRGLALVAAGALDGEGVSVESLAERLGVGSRQLRRLFRQHLGASPIAVAQTRRILFAKQLVHDTRLPMAEIALAAGFGSVRRFNEVFRDLYGRPPSALRRAAVTKLGDLPMVDHGVTVRLRYRAPYDWPAMLAYLRRRALEGVEHVDAERWARTVTLGPEVGIVEVAHVPEASALAATIRLPTVRPLGAIVARIRLVFDLGADVATIGAHLARDRALAGLVAAHPGLRVPGGWDGFELAARVVLGQQVTVEQGRRLSGQLAALCGTPLPTAAPHGLVRTFPGPAQVVNADLRALGMPDARRRALVALAAAALEDPDLFEPRDTVEQTVARLRAIPGVGEWTAQCIALRAVREPDAFPAQDVGLLRGAAGQLGPRPTPAELLERSERWRPWRAYAAEHLWAADPARPSPSARSATA